MEIVAVLALAGFLYGGASFCVPRARKDALDFPAATGPRFMGLCAGVALTTSALVGFPESAETGAVLRGWIAGAMFVAVPQGLAVLRRRFAHQWEVAGFCSVRSIMVRNMAMALLVFPAVALCEQTLLRGAWPVPGPAAVGLQWILLFPRGRRSAVEGVIPCAFMGGLHMATGSVWMVIGAHAALQTLTGRLGTAGLFGDAYALGEQINWRNLCPAWQQALAEVAVGVCLCLFL